MMCSVCYCLRGWLVGWLLERFVGWLILGLVVSLVEWLLGCLFDMLNGWLLDCLLASQRFERLFECLGGCLIDWLFTELFWLTVSLIDVVVVRLVDLFVDWSIGDLLGGSIGCLADCLMIWLFVMIGYLIDFWCAVVLIDGFIVWLVSCCFGANWLFLLFVGWLVAWLVVCLNCWWFDCLFDWPMVWFVDPLFVYFDRVLTHWLFGRFVARLVGSSIG